MTTMTIIACKILQDELVYILERDPSIDKIKVIDTGEQKEFVEKLEKFESLKDKIRIINPDELQNYGNEGSSINDKNEIIINLQKLALHVKPKLLKEAIYEEIKKYSEISDGILLFYGMCGNGLDQVDEDFKELNTCKLEILKDRTGRIVDDCIGATLGGWAEYMDALKSVSKPKTYLFTPMYAKHWKEIIGAEYRKAGFGDEKMIEMVKLTNKLTDYKRVAKLNTGLDYTGTYDEDMKKYSELLDLELIELDLGNQDLFVECYENMKRELGVIGSDQF